MSKSSDNPINKRSLIILLLIIALAVAGTGMAAFSYLKDREQKNDQASKIEQPDTSIQKTPQVSAVDANNCSITKGKNLIVTIENSRVSPRVTDAKLCDSITFINKDHERLLTFGVHDQHVTYNGVTDKVLKAGESLTITLDAVNTIPFHDHDQQEVEGVFTVTKN